jgi:SAM-dependent methyltransferase
MTGEAGAYAGEAGERYFGYQERMGRAGASLNRWKFLEHVDSGRVVLDFGCGGGWLLAGLPAARRLGVEPNAAAAAIAREQGIEVYPAAAAVPDAVAEVVISNHALEHAASPFAELRELHRALRPGGRLVLWIPLDDWRVQRRPAANPDHHLYAWTPLLLANLLEAAGFGVDECRVVAHAWPPRFERLMRLPTPLFDALGRVWSVLRRRRQIVAIAHRAED